MQGFFSILSWKLEGKRSNKAMERSLDCDSQKSLCLCSPWGGSGSDIPRAVLLQPGPLQQGDSPKQGMVTHSCFQGLQQAIAQYPVTRDTSNSPIPRDVSESFVGWESGGIMGNNLSTVSSEVCFACGKGIKHSNLMYLHWVGEHWVMWLNYKFHHNLHTWPFVCAHLVWSG